MNFYSTSHHVLFGKQFQRVHKERRTKPWWALPLAAHRQQNYFQFPLFCNMQSPISEEIFPTFLHHPSALVTAGCRWTRKTLTSKWEAAEQTNECICGGARVDSESWRLFLEITFSLTNGYESLKKISFKINYTFSRINY